jgi:hypothetical protein
MQSGVVNLDELTLNSPARPTEPITNSGTITSTSESVRYPHVVLGRAFFDADTEGGVDVGGVARGSPRGLRPDSRVLG